VKLNLNFTRNYAITYPNYKGRAQNPQKFHMLTLKQQENIMESEMELGEGYNVGKEPVEDIYERSISVEDTMFEAPTSDSFDDIYNLNEAKGPLPLWDP
jgi:hypothetical protein